MAAINFPYGGFCCGGTAIKAVFHRRDAKYAEYIFLSKNYLLRALSASAVNSFLDREVCVSCEKLYSSARVQFSGGQKRKGGIFARPLLTRNSCCHLPMSLSAAALMKA